MNVEQTIGLINVVKSSTDKGVVYKCLLKLRTDLVKDNEGIIIFQKSGGISPMVRLLNKPHEKILEIVLSILGNCCTNKICCDEALQNKIYLPLTIILKSIPNPVIQCRACRLLGNLAKSEITQLLSTHCPAIAQAVCQIIETTTDVQTRIMAFRACRFLLASPQFLKHFLMANGFVQMLQIFAAIMKNNDVASQETKEIPASLGLKKNQPREKYFEEVARNLEGVRSDIFDHEVLKNSNRNLNEYALPKQEEALNLANEILKCLFAMSAMQINLRIWEYISRQNCTFSPLVYFASVHNKQRSVALKILSNFSKNPGAFYMLSNADAIFAACELLVTADMSKPLTESELRHCINIICILSTDACNRSKIRRSGALCKLIIMIRDSESQSERSSILHILNNFQYDNLSMELMLREGLITVLIRELNNYLTCDDEYHKRKREERLQNNKKRKISENVVQPICKYAKLSEMTLVDIDSPNSSPRSCQSPASPCSSRSMSPVSLNFFQDNGDADDDNYSPACSDDDATDDEDRTYSGDLHANRNSDNIDVMNLLDIVTEAIDDNISDKEDLDDTSQDAIHIRQIPINNALRGTIEIIENLIFRITLMINKRAELGKPDTINTLIKAINIFGSNNNFANALTNILLESQFFAQIIKQGIAHQLYQMTKLDEIRKDGFAFLETLKNVGESNYGKAELVRLLRSDNVVSQKRAAISVAYIIKDYHLLYKFLNDGNALSLLFEMLLTNKTDELTAEAADAVTSMARNTLLLKTPDAENLEEFNHCTDTVNEHIFLHENCDMRFVVLPSAENDETPVIIGFNKQLLCDASEVFKTMLNSNFREGNESEIQMRQYSASGLRYFLNLIIRQSSNQKFNIPPSGKFYALLEAFEMSQVYLILEMEKPLKKLLKQLLDAENCLRLLEWALKNYHEELTETAINYYLCSKLNTTEKVALFQEAENSKHSATWIQLINNAVYDRLRNG